MQVRILFSFEVSAGSISSSWVSHLFLSRNAVVHHGICHVCGSLLLTNCWDQQCIDHASLISVSSNALVSWSLADSGEIALCMCKPVLRDVKWLAQEHTFVCNPTNLGALTLHPLLSLSGPLPPFPNHSRLTYYLLSLLTPELETVSDSPKASDIIQTSQS